MKTIAVMQPYFLPYAGYFRLFAAADTVALFDCVQFPRRGWVHRNRLPDTAGNPAWLTLPIARAPRETPISALRFASDADTRFAAQCARFPDLQKTGHPLLDVMQTTLQPAGNVADYLERLLKDCCRMLGLSFDIVRTSTLPIAPDLRGQDRVLAIAETIGAERYVNLEGGGVLYDPAVFAEHGMELRILEPWDGSRWSILHRLLTEPPEDVAREIRAQA
jgi:hypothetical protein